MSFITIGEHLIKRLSEIGIDTVFGVPGDYNMPLLDIIEDCAFMTWGNNANELNASYAADAYARIRGAGAIVTTFGVGELSAINGLAGSYAEMIPVIHIVGCPNTVSQEAKAILHHSLGDGNFCVFAEMSKEISGAHTQLTLENAVSEIDRVIQTAYTSKRTGYIGIPIDLINAKIKIHDTLPLELAPSKNPKVTQDTAIKQILECIRLAKHPAIVVDGCVVRHHMKNDVNAFVKRSGFPTFTTPMSKGIIEEDLPNYRGMYVGNITLEGVAIEFQQADLLIELGSFKSDLNTGNFSYGAEKAKVISLHSFGTIICHAEYPKAGMVELLPLLTAALPERKTDSITFPPRIRSAPIDNSTIEITHNYFWNKISKFIEPNSVIVSDSGSSTLGVFNMQIPQNTTFIGQILWASIGYSVGATVGAAIADRSRRVYVFVGDGAFQIALQEISVLLHHGLTPVIFLMNNDGYLIEKLINGPHRPYNNFQMWEYSKTLDYFGGHLKHNRLENKKLSTIGLEDKVFTRQEFEAAMDIVSKEPNKIHFLEVILPRFDSPRELKLLVAPPKKNK